MLEVNIPIFLLCCLNTIGAQQTAQPGGRGSSAASSVSPDQTIPRVGAGPGTGSVSPPLLLKKKKKPLIQHSVEHPGQSGQDVLEVCGVRMSSVLGLHQSCPAGYWAGTCPTGTQVSDSRGKGSLASVSLKTPFCGANKC